jgi:hypothetical protein
MNRNVITTTDAANARSRISQVSKQSVPATDGASNTIDKTRDITLGGGIDTDVRPDKWFERLAKFIPAEALSLYLALAGIIPEEHTKNRQGLFWLCAVLGVCLLFNALYLSLIWKVARGTQIAISCVAVVTYAFSTGGALVSNLSFYQPWIGTLVLIVVTAFLAFFTPPTPLPVANSPT